MTTLIAEPKNPARTGAARDRLEVARVVAMVIFGAIAFVLTAGAWEFIANRLHARPEIPEPFQSKIDLCLNGGNYDTLFIGSSRYFHGFDPTTFDAETARLGVPTHSYNLGFDALNFIESRFVIRHVLADPRAHLKYLFVEPSLRIRLAPGLEHSQRAIVLHDTSGSIETFELVLRGNHDWKRKLYWLYEQAGVSAVRLSNVGALTNKYIRPQEPPVPASELIGPMKNGFIGLDPNVLLGPKTDASDLQQMIADQTTAEKSGNERDLNDYEISQLTDLNDMLAAQGVKMILVAPPTATEEMYGEFSAIAKAKLPGIPVFCFANPKLYPDLYDPKGFVDPDHISQPVAERLTLHTADLFAGVVKEHQH